MLANLCSHSLNTILTQDQNPIFILILQQMDKATEVFCKQMSKMQGAIVCIKQCGDATLVLSAFIKNSASVSNCCKHKKLLNSKFSKLSLLVAIYLLWSISI